MLDVVFYLALFVAGFAVLLKSAGFIVSNASSLAKEAGVSSLAVGATIVSVSTTLPELSVTLLSAFSGLGAVGTGTIVGTLIVNIGLIIGLPALIKPVKTGRWHAKQCAATLIFTAALALLLSDGLAWYDGIVLIAMFAVYIRWLSRNVRGGRKKKHKASGVRGRIAKSVAAGVVVFAAAEMLIISTEGLAPVLGIPDFVIAFLALALGTSLPEFATSLIALKKGERDISLGNIMGANIIDVFILGLASLITFIPATAVGLFGIPMMVVITFLLFAFLRWGRSLSRFEGLVILALYAVFVALTLA
jgi:cation:H+ antiporter